MDLHLSSIQPKSFLHLGKQGALCQGETGEEGKWGNGEMRGDARVVGMKRGKDG